MKKFLRVVVYEYTQGVFRWGFLLGLLSLPLFALVMGIVIVLSLLPEIGLQPVGYVDHSGFLAEAAVPAEQMGSPIPLIPYASETQAGAALQVGEIQAYYVLEAGFEQSSQARLIARERVNSMAHMLFTEFVRSKLLAGQPEQVARRVRSGGNLSVRALDGSRQTGQGGLVGIYLPAVAGLGLMVVVFSSSGYLLTAIMEERTNSTLEMLVTSVSSLQLVGGKTIGLLAVGLTQILFWLSPLLFLLVLQPKALILLTAQFFPPASLGLMVVTFIPTLVMFAALMMAIGSVSADYRDAQIIVSLLFLPIYVPLGLLTLITKNPNSPLAVGLSFFPLTAPVVVSMRAAVASIPLKQAALIITIQALFALFAIWLAGRAWRIGLWNPGWRISFRRIFSRCFSLRRLLRRSQPTEDPLP